LAIAIAVLMVFQVPWECTFGRVVVALPRCDPIS